MRGWLPLVALLVAVAASVTVGVVAPRIPLGAYALVSLALCTAPGGVTLALTRGRFGAPLLVAGPAIAALVSLVTWTLAHPVVHIDNATRTPIQLWIDGEPAMILPPGRGDREPPSVRMPLGAHRLGFSAVGAERPARSTAAPISAFAAFLYSPGDEGCYWLEAAAYGDENTLGLPHGPQKVDAFYRFDRVDAWFTDVPTHVEAPRIFSGRRHVALQRYRACMDLQQAGCSAGERALFVECQRTIQGPGEAVDCYDLAMKVCALQRLFDAPAREGGPVRPADGSRPK
jgi:hypothetical protein